MYIFFFFCLDIDFSILCMLVKYFIIEVESSILENNFKSIELWKFDKYDLKKNRILNLILNAWRIFL